MTHNVVIQDLPSTFYNERPSGVQIDTIVIHNIHAPQCTERFDVPECLSLLNAHSVSAHYVIARTGDIFCLVPPEKRAWHAGRSRLIIDSQEICSELNDNSIGIEIIGTDHEAYTDDQYLALSLLTMELSLKFPISYIVGHSQIAPDRKTDPGQSFDWQRYENSLSQLPSVQWCYKSGETAG